MLLGAAASPLPRCPAHPASPSRLAPLSCRNGSGKTCFLNNLIQLGLVVDNEEYRTRGGDQQPGLQLLAPYYGDWDSVRAAMDDRELMVQFNTRPQPDVEGARHMQMVESSLANHYKGQRSGFGRQKRALLLPVGKPTDTTTQVRCCLVGNKVEGRAAAAIACMLVGTAVQPVAASPKSCVCPATWRLHTTCPPTLHMLLPVPRRLPSKCGSGRKWPASSFSEAQPRSETKWKRC